MTPGWIGYDHLERPLDNKAYTPCTHRTSSAFQLVHEDTASLPAHSSIKQLDTDATDQPNGEAKGSPAQRLLQR